MEVRIAKCRSCQADCVWMKTWPNEKNILVDVEGIDEATTEPHTNFPNMPMYNPKVGHTAHFATCPDADKWRTG